MLLSGSRDRLGKPGVFGRGFMFAGTSERGGEGGVGASELEAFDLAGGGVDTVGEGGVVPDAAEICDSGLAGFACIGGACARLA